MRLNKNTPLSLRERSYDALEPMDLSWGKSIVFESDESCYGYIDFDCDDSLFFLLSFKHASSVLSKLEAWCLVPEKFALESLVLPC